LGGAGAKDGWNVATAGAKRQQHIAKGHHHIIQSAVVAMLRLPHALRIHHLPAPLTTFHSSQGEDGPDFTRFGYSLNVLDPSNTTGILLEITSSQDLKMLKMMHGACLGLLDPNIVHGRLPDPTSENPDPLFETPLFEAIRGGNREIVGYLLKMGANRELKNGAGETPLMVAEKIRLAGMVKQSKVRLDDERSDELITQSQAANTTASRTSVQDAPPSPLITAIILTHHPNPFRDSLRSSQKQQLWTDMVEVKRGEERRDELTATILTTRIART